MRTLLISLSLLLLVFVNSFALSVEEKLPNEEQEQRAINLFLQVRCLVCNGQVIENSDAEFSYEMRKLIRKKIAQNYSDQQIKEFLVKSFGNDILTEVNKDNGGYILWLTPLIFAVLLGFFLVIKKTNKN